LRPIRKDPLPFEPVLAVLSVRGEASERREVTTSGSRGGGGGAAGFVVVFGLLVLLFLVEEDFGATVGLGAGRGVEATGAGGLLRGCWGG
jgi:hypothetical protein